MCSESWNRIEDEWNFCLYPTNNYCFAFCSTLYQHLGLGAFSELTGFSTWWNDNTLFIHSIPIQVKLVFWTTQSLFSISHIWSHDIFGYYSNFWSCVETVLLLALPPLELSVDHLPRALAPGLHLHPWNEQQSIKANHHPNQNITHSRSASPSLQSQKLTNLQLLDFLNSNNN